MQESCEINDAEKKFGFGYMDMKVLDDLHIKHAAYLGPLDAITTKDLA